MLPWHLSQSVTAISAETGPPRGEERDISAIETSAHHPRVRWPADPTHPLHRVSALSKSLPPTPRWRHAAHVAPRTHCSPGRNSDDEMMLILSGAAQSLKLFDIKLVCTGAMAFRSLILSTRGRSRIHTSYKQRRNLSHSSCTPGVRATQSSFAQASSVKHPKHRGVLYRSITRLHLNAQGRGGLVRLRTCLHQNTQWRQ